MGLVSPDFLMFLLDIHLPNCATRAMLQSLFLLTTPTLPTSFKVSAYILFQWGSLHTVRARPSNLSVIPFADIGSVKTTDRPETIVPGVKISDHYRIGFAILSVRRGAF